MGTRQKQRIVKKPQNITLPFIASTESDINNCIAGQNSTK